MNGGTHLGMMVQIARWGGAVVPSMMTHCEKGIGTLYMDGDGIRFEPFDKAHAPLILTWEEFDAGEKNENKN